MIAPPGRMRRAAGPSLLTKTGRCSKAKSRAVTTTAIHHPSPLKARLDEPIQVTSSMKWPEQSEALRAPLCRHRFLETGNFLQLAIVESIALHAARRRALIR